MENSGLCHSWIKPAVRCAGVRPFKRRRADLRVDQDRGGDRSGAALKRLPAGGSLVCYRVAYRRSRAVYSSIPAITELLNTFTRASAVSGTPLTVAG